MAAVFISPNHADAYAVFIVASYMGTLLFQMTACDYRAITLDDEVVAKVFKLGLMITGILTAPFKATLFMPLINIRCSVWSTIGRGAAMDYNSINGPFHISLG